MPAEITDALVSLLALCLLLVAFGFGATLVATCVLAVGLAVMDWRDGRRQRRDARELVRLHDRYARAAADTIEWDALEDWPVLPAEPPAVFPRRRRAA